MALTKIVPTTKRVPIKVLSLELNKPVREGSLLVNLPCSACGKPIGNRRWGLAWVKDNKGKHAMRLCEECAKKAEE